jgi:hypothetical protein
MVNQGDSHRKRRPRRGDMTALASILWRAILVGEDVLVAATEPELRLRAINTLGQAAAHYGKISETIDLTKRVEALEQALQQRRR